MSNFFSVQAIVMRTPPTLLIQVIVIFLRLLQVNASNDMTCAATPTQDEHPECTLKRAYAVKTPEDSVNLYRHWADTYDSGFVAQKGYVMPQRIANLFSTITNASIPKGALNDRGLFNFYRGTVLDIGAGTGLVAEHLEGDVDGIDISAEMLGKAEAKGLYRKRIVADLTKPLDMIPSATYNGFVSSGTFTTGHVGPVCLSELFRIAKPNALFVLAANKRAFDNLHFGSELAEYVASGTITPVDFKKLGFYDGSMQHEHVNDTGLVMVFRRV